MDALQLSTTKLTSAVCYSAAHCSSKYETKPLRHGKKFCGIPDVEIWDNKFFPMFWLQR